MSLPYIELLHTVYRKRVQLRNCLKSQKTKLRLHRKTKGGRGLKMKQTSRQSELSASYCVQTTCNHYAVNAFWQRFHTVNQNNSLQTGAINTRVGKIWAFRCISEIIKTIIYCYESLIVCQSYQANRVVSTTPSYSVHFATVGLQYLFQYLKANRFKFDKHRIAHRSVLTVDDLLTKDETLESSGLR